MQEDAIKLLFVIYSEVNSRTPHIEMISYDSLEMEEQVFHRAVNSLYQAGLINGVSIKIGDDDKNCSVVSIEHAVLTRRGAKFIEKQAKISDALPKMEKLIRLGRKAEQLGWGKVDLLINKAIKDLSI